MHFSTLFITLADRQYDPDDCAVLRLTMDIDTASGEMDQLLGDGHAQDGSYKSWTDEVKIK
ncbi:hypothetical protein [Cytobacillus firmus]|uniref:hypothetical protein n=1 Tax=Cytobacillus firmus TaxID=1399 RepID=UPI0004B28A39|nr:hypothetical protein [Cytobacillus firmus]